MYTKTKSQLKESYDHIKNYLDEQKELKKMCNMCENYYDKDHDYENCKNMPCFQFYLAYEYLEWSNSWDGGHDTI